MAYNEKSDGSVVVMVHLTLRNGRDDDMIQLVKSAPRGGLASVIRETMRTGIHKNDEELYEEAEVEMDLSDWGFEI
jgi:hypothetical protein